MSTLAKLKEIIREELNLLNATPAKGKSNNMITLKSIIEGARYVRKPLKESHMSNIDLMANEAKNFKDFVKQFYAEYKDFPKDKATGIWLKDIYDNRSGLDEATNKNDTYFNTATEAVMYARTQAEKKGFEIDENDWNSEITTGGRYSRTRPGIGKTHSFSVGLSKAGKPQRKNLNISLYGMESGNFELTYYIN
jgi:hypothetical protein